MWFLKKALPSREEPDISLSIVNSKARLYLLIFAHYARIISLKRGIALNTCSNDFIRRYIERGHHVSGKIASGVAVRDDGSVAGEGRVVGVPKFYS